MLQELKTHHREVARLRFEGLSPKDIAERTDSPIQTVYSILRDPLCKSYLDGLHDKADSTTIDVRRKLAEMNTQALDTLKWLLTSGDIPPSVQLGAAKDVLDRNGYKPPERHEHLSVHLTAEDILELRQRQTALIEPTDVSHREHTI